jgi:hypothetical protein
MDLREAIAIANERGHITIAALIQSALDKLGEPTPEVIAATRLVIRHDYSYPITSSDARDIAAVVTRAALTWERP